MTDLFKNDEQNTDESKPDEKTSDGTSNSETYLGLIVNEEGKQKYATVEEALKGTVHAQSHITTLETELQELRANADKGVDMEQILAALKPDDKSGEQEQKPSGLTAEDVARTVEQLLEKRASETTSQENITTVTSTFKKLYGEKASEIMYTKAEDLGFSKSEINSMIVTNPNATLRILGVDKEKVIKSDPVTDSSGHILDLSSGKTEEKPATIMGATNSSALTDAWKASKEATLKRLEANGL